MKTLMNVTFIKGLFSIPGADRLKPLTERTCQDPSRVFCFLGFRRNRRKFALHTTCSWIWRETHPWTTFAARNWLSTTPLRSSAANLLGLEGWVPEEPEMWRGLLKGVACSFLLWEFSLYFRQSLFLINLALVNGHMAIHCIYPGVIPDLGSGDLTAMLEAAKCYSSAPRCSLRDHMPFQGRKNAMVAGILWMPLDGDVFLSSWLLLFPLCELPLWSAWCH